MLAKQIPITISNIESPKLIVVVDTEEEFDWFQEPNREASSVTAINHIERVQSIFDEYSIVPCYVVDYPVASKQEGYQVLKEIYDDGRCEIGAHLQPWVNPPYVEKLSRYNMFPGNLKMDIEREKLKTLCSRINDNLGVYPKIYKAGRYGIGANTAKILEELGFEIDVSICPPVDYTEEGGPDYSNYQAVPFWFGENKMLEIPVTGAFVGWAGMASKSIYTIANRLKKFKVPGILSRISAVDRLMLSPEGFNTEDHIKITHYLYNRGVRTFTWSFHSPSVVPGFTPYVTSEKDLRIFLDSFREYFDFFFNELNGEASTPINLKQQLEIS